MKYLPIPSTTSSDTWRPWTLQRPFLLSFIIFCILLAICIELTVHACNSTGCHVFGGHNDAAIPFLTGFAYNQLPTVVGLALSLLWALPHHDLMRLEPYFRLSQPGGARAEDSLFLEYSYTFVLLIPFKAAKRKHWVVFLSSIILVVMNFVVVPLISGIFEDTVLTKPIPASGTRAVFPGGNQSLTGSFVSTAYDIAWLNGSLPAFTTKEFALLPVRNGTEVVTRNETWTVDTTLFEASMNCTRAEVSYNESSVQLWSPKGQSLTYCDIDGNHNNSNSNCSRWTTFATRWTCLGNQIETHDDGTASYVYAFAKGVGAINITTPSGVPTLVPPEDIVAVYCRTGYWAEDVTAELAMPVGEVKGVVRKAGSKRRFSPLADFSAVVNGSFQPVIPEQYKDKTGEVVGFGYRPEQLPDLITQLAERFGKRVKYNTTGGDQGIAGGFFVDSRVELSSFAMYGAYNNTVERFLDFREFTNSLERALQLLFAVAMKTEVIDERAADPVELTRNIRTRGFVVDRLWARLTEGGIAVIVMITLLLMVMVEKRDCALDGEPNSLGAALRILDASPDFCTIIDNAEFHSPEDILEILSHGGSKFKLDLTPGKGPTLQSVTDSEVDQSTRPTLSAPVAAQETWVQSAWGMTIISGFAYLFCLTVVVAVLVTAFVYSRINDGLPTFMTIDSLGYKLIYMYIPIAVGMIIEPALVSLGSCHCMLGPYKALKGGHARSSVSLAVDFDRSPPHFQLLRSLRSMNFTLAGLTIAILLSNVLAVAFAGLFSAVAEQVQTSKNLTINEGFGGFGSEMYYILAKSLENSDTTLPPWTTKDYYIVPFSAPEANGQSFTGTTHGIGVNIRCDIVEPSRYTLGCVDRMPGSTSNPCTEIHKYGQTSYIQMPNLCTNPILEERQHSSTTEILHVSVTESLSGDSTYYIVDEGIRELPDWIEGNNINDGGSGTYTWDSASGDTLINARNCSDRLIALWAELPPDSNASDSSAYFNTPAALVLTCTYFDKVVNLTATMGLKGQVNSVEGEYPLSPMEIDALYTPAMEGQRLSASFQASLIKGLSGSTHEIDWLNYLMATKDKSIVRHPVNATHLPYPNITSVFESVYRQLFAVNLGLNAQTILSAQSSGMILMVKEGKVYVSGVMFYIALAILAYMIVVLVALYVGQDRLFVGHLPQNLVGMYAHLYKSNAKVVCGAAGLGELEQLEGRYSFGKFDHEKHTGVYKESEGLPIKESRRGKE